MIRDASKYFLCAAAMVSGLLAGCNRGPERIHPPAINPASAGAAAIAEYDANGDGAIAGEELDEAAALQAAIENLDQNQDARVTADEIAARIKAWQASQVGITAVSCRVTMDDAPLEGATVVFDPPEFLGENIKPASGVTDSQGTATLSIAEQDRQDPRLSGMHCGLYQVRITKDGQVPARYNTETTLGAEVALDVADLEQGLHFDLQSM